MTKPVFSIITCAYNSEEYIQECLDSLVIQEFSNYEHLIIYSPSKDKTLEIINKYINNNHEKDIKLIECEPNGISNAMNIGIRNARGNIIHFLHTDDYFYNKDTLEVVYKYFENNKELECLIGNKTLKYEHNKISFSINFPTIYKKWGTKLIYIFNWVPHAATFIKKDIFEKHGYFKENLEYGMDYEFWIRTLKFINITIVNNDFTVYRRHEKSKSGSIKNLLNMIKEDIKIKHTILNNK